MRERPILFSAPMVRAIMAGRKTQTRRLIGLREFQPSETRGYDWTFRDKRALWQDYNVVDLVVSKHNRYGAPGDRLWVKETHAFYQPDPGQFLYGKLDTLGIRKYGGGAPESPRDLRVNSTDAMVVYAAHPKTYAELPAWSGYDTYSPNQPERWRPSIFMPRWASRITLEITKVRVERAQSISKDDAIAEGARRFDDIPPSKMFPGSPHQNRWSMEQPEDCGHCLGSPQSAFGNLWIKINGQDSWDANPWVWVVEFRRVQP